MAIYLSLKEIWRNETKYLLFSLVIALISLLVLFTAGLGEGLATNNKEYLEKLDAQLLVFQTDVNYPTTASRLDYKKYKRAKRIIGLEDVGPIAFSNVDILRDRLSSNSNSDMLHYPNLQSTRLQYGRSQT